MLYVIFSIYILLTSLGMVLIKYGGGFTSFELNKSNIDIHINYLFIIGFLLYIFSFLLWIYILQKFKITFISPIAYGLTFIALILFSYLIIGDTINFRQIIGTVIIIGGVIFCIINY